MSQNSSSNTVLNRRSALVGMVGASAITLIGSSQQARAAGNVREGSDLSDFASEGHYKASWLIRKNPAVSLEEFKTWYLGHARDVAASIGTGLAYYRLTFPIEQRLGMNVNEVGEEGSYTGPRVRLEWDCIAEMGSSNPALFDALSASGITTPEAAANQADEAMYVDYATVISLYSQEYTFVS